MKIKFHTRIYTIDANFEKKRRFFNILWQKR